MLSLSRSLFRPARLAVIAGVSVAVAAGAGVTPVFAASRARSAAGYATPSTSAPRVALAKGTGKGGHQTPSPSPGVVPVGGGGGCGSTLTANEELISGAELCSPDGSYTLDMQTDGNLVEYNASGQALWATDTSGHSGADLVMQTDGNLVVYSSSGQAVWASGTYGIGGGTTYLSIQNDSNVVLYDSSGAVWAVRDFSPQTYAQEIMFHFGWSQAQWTYLDELWQRESGWQWNVCNGGGTYPTCDYTGVAYGIPQANPGSKMGSVWPDWPTDPFTQITWGEQYIAGTYGNPENAWNHEVNYGWYAVTASARS